MDYADQDVHARAADLVEGRPLDERVGTGTPGPKMIEGIPAAERVAESIHPVCPITEGSRPSILVLAATARALGAPAGISRGSRTRPTRRFAAKAGSSRAMLWNNFPQLPLR